MWMQTHKSIIPFCNEVRMKYANECATLLMTLNCKIFLKQMFSLFRYEHWKKKEQLSDEFRHKSAWKNES